MASRVDLQSKLEEILGSRNVYYKAPENIKMNYPAIIYSLNNIEDRNANNSSYIRNRSYSVTVISKQSDPEVINKLLELPYCSFDRPYVSDNLNHYVFTLYW